MKFLTLTFVLLSFALLFPTQMQAQDKLSAEDKAKLALADRATATFVERFRRTLDFETVWKEFDRADDNCGIRTTPGLPQYNGIELKQKPYEERLREAHISDDLLRRYFYSYWNSSLLFWTFMYTVSPTKNGAEPDFESRTIRVVGYERIAKLVAEAEKHDDMDEEPPTAKTLERAIRRHNHFASVVRKYMPPNALRTANWKSAIQWFHRLHNLGGIDEREDFKGWCFAGRGPVYIAQTGFFVFGFVEEKGKMKLWLPSFIYD